MTPAEAALTRIIDATEDVAEVTRHGSRVRHEIEMALICLRNAQREAGLWQWAKAGEIGPAPAERPRFGVVQGGAPAPVDDPAFDV